MLARRLPIWSSMEDDGSGALLGTSDDDRRGDYEEELGDHGTGMREKELQKLVQTQLFNKWLLEHRVNNCWELWYDGEHEARAGRAGIGVLLRRPDGSVETSLSKCIPTATPAEAEYKALIAGLVEALRRNAKRLVAHGEKEVVTEQVNGTRRLGKRDAHTVPLYATVVQLAKRFKDFKLERVDVEDNGKAHLLAMRALKAIRR